MEIKILSANDLGSSVKYQVKDPVPDPGTSPCLIQKSQKKKMGKKMKNIGKEKEKNHGTFR